MCRSKRIKLTGALHCSIAAIGPRFAWAGSLLIGPILLFLGALTPASLGAELMRPKYHHGQVDETGDVEKPVDETGDVEKA